MLPPAREHANSFVFFTAPFTILSNYSLLLQPAEPRGPRLRPFLHLEGRLEAKIRPE